MCRTEVALVCVETSREAVDIAGCVCAAPASGDGGEADEGGCFLAFSGEKRGCSDV